MLIKVFFTINIGLHFVHIPEYDALHAICATFKELDRTRVERRTVVFRGSGLNEP